LTSQSEYLSATTTEFRKLKELADKAVQQVPEKAFFATVDANSNSLAVIFKHVGGNLTSRWTDFLTTDGEKVDRDRDGEFDLGQQESRASIEAVWERGWARLFETLGSLRAEELGHTVTIRGEPFTALGATQRSLSHTAQHVGQIVFLAKHFAGAGWTTLSIPRKRETLPID